MTSMGIPAVSRLACGGLRLLFSFLLDPCLHLLIIGFALLAYGAAAPGPDDPESHGVYEANRLIILDDWRD